MKRLAFSTKLNTTCFNRSRLPSTSGASPMTWQFASLSRKSGERESTTSRATCPKSTRENSVAMLPLSSRCNASRSFTRFERRRLSSTMMPVNFSRIAGGRSGSDSISAFPRIAVSGVRSSCATSLTNVLSRLSREARLSCCVRIVSESLFKLTVSRSTSSIRPSMGMVVGAGSPVRKSRRRAAKRVSGSERKCPMSRLKANVNTATGTKRKNAKGRSPNAKCDTAIVKTAARMANSVARSAKYVCSCFIS